MASDDIVWDIINQQFCSFKTKLPSKAQTFCRNEYNATGLCSRQSCPLANSRYATIRAAADGQDQSLYLYTKTVERAHLPSRMWEKVRLPANYAEALALVDAKLAYWPKFLVHKCKQRLTRLTQVALRSRRLAKEEQRLGERVVPRLAPKVRKREEGRERKALSAAKIERQIERELLERLRNGAYSEAPLNVDEGIWQKVLRGLEREGEAERDEDLDEGEAERDEDLDEGEDESEQDAELEYEHEDGDGQVEYVSDIDGSESEGGDDDLGDLEDGGPLAWGDGASSDDAEGDEDDDSEGASERDDGGDDAAEVKRMLAALQRKRPAAGNSNSNSSKKARRAGRDGSGGKGARREIEYELETEAARERALA